MVALLASSQPSEIGQAMAAVYGFRIHTMEPHVQRSQEYLQIEDVSAAGGEVDAFDQIRKELLDLQSDATQIGYPTYYVSKENEDERDARLKNKEMPYFQVMKVDVTGRVIEVTVETGKEADHDALVSRDGTHEPIKNKAAVRRSTVILIFPKKGSMALMVSEVRGRNYAGELLIEWLTRRAQRAVVSVDAKNNRKEDPWLNWKLTPQIDGQRLDGILNGSADHTLRLKRRTVTPAGTRASYDLELVQFGLKKSPLSSLVKVLTDMAARAGKGTADHRRAEATKDVISLVDANVAGLDFTDAELSFKENGKTQTVNSETIEQLFVYPLGLGRPSVTDLKAAATPVVQRIGPGLGIQTNLSVQP